MRRALALLLLLLAAAAPSSSAAPLPTVAGTTVLSGTTSGKVTVRVPPGATFDVSGAGFAPSTPSATVAGKGRSTGAVLVHHAARDHRWSDGDLELWTLKFGYCDTQGCGSSNPDGVFQWQALATPKGPTPLPAGTYDLYLVTDGAPVTVTLRFGGLSGTTRLRPTTAVQVDQFVPVPVGTTAAGVTSATYTGGTTSHLRGYGAIVVGDVMLGKPVGNQEAQHCLARLDGEDARPLTPTGCPGSVEGFDSHFAVEGPGPGWMALTESLGAVPGSWFMGMDGTYQGAADHYQAVNLALTW